MSYLAQLKTFLEVHREGSMSRAADNLGITQPTASLHIQILENLIGKPLFVRQARGVSPTAVADELACSVSSHIDSLELKLATFRHGSPQGGTVHIAAPAEVVHYLLVDKISPLLAQGFHFRLQTGGRERLYELLESNSVDFAITSSLPDPARYEYRHWLAEDYLLVFAPSLKQKIGSGDKQTLSQIPMIAYDETLPVVRDIWRTMFGIPPNLQAAVTVPDLRIAKQLALNGAGWTALGDFHCRQELAEGKLLTLTTPATMPKNHLYLVWRKQGIKNSAAKCVLEAL